MDGWIEIFRTGKHTDMRGRTIEFTAPDLAGVARSYNRLIHEAPIWIEHQKPPQGNLGLIEEVKLVGRTLLAKPRATSPEFSENRLALPPRISPSFYSPDSPSNPVPGLYYLKEVSLVDIPAVKGMEPPAFSEGQDDGLLMFGCEWCGDDDRDPLWIKNDDLLSTMFLNLREWMISRDGIESADRVVPMAAIEKLMQVLSKARMEQLMTQPEAAEMTASTAVDAETIADTPSYSEADLAAFAEREARLKQRELELDRRDFSSFAEGLLNDGRQFDHALATEFYSALGSGAETVSFSEGGETVSRSPQETFKAFLSTLPKTVDFAERAPASKMPPADMMNDPVAMAEKAKKYRDRMKKEGKTISMTEAMAWVQKNPMEA